MTRRATKGKSLRSSHLDLHEPLDAKKLAALGKLVRERREKIGWSVRHLNEVTGRTVSTPYIYQIEALEEGQKEARLFRPSLEVLRQLATTLDLDIYQLMEYAGYSPPTRRSVLSQVREEIRNSTEALKHLEIQYMSLIRSERLTWSDQSHLEIHHGDHILLLVASDNERPFALEVLSQFIRDGATRHHPPEGCLFFTRDAALSDRLKDLEPQTIDEAKFERMKTINYSPDSPHELLLRFPWTLTERILHQQDFTFPNPRDIFAALARHFSRLGEMQRAEIRFARWVLEDADQLLSSLGSTDTRRSHERQEYLQYEDSWADEMTKWSYPAKPPVLLCQYIVQSSIRNQGLNNAELRDLSLDEILFRLLKAHDRVWLIPPSENVILEGPEAVKLLLQMYVFPLWTKGRRRCPWQDLHYIGVKYGIWTAEIHA